MLTNCLAACVHLTIIVSEIQQDIGVRYNGGLDPLVVSNFNFYF